MTRRTQVVLMAMMVCLQGGFAGPYGQLNPEAVAAAYEAAMESLTAAASSAAPASSAAAPVAASGGNGDAATPAAGEWGMLPTPDGSGVRMHHASAVLGRVPQGENTCFAAALGGCERMDMCLDLW